MAQAEFKTEYIVAFAAEQSSYRISDNGYTADYLKALALSDTDGLNRMDVARVQKIKDAGDYYIVVYLRRPGSTQVVTIGESGNLRDYLNANYRRYASMYGGVIIARFEDEEFTRPVDMDSKKLSNIRGVTIADDRTGDE